MCRLLPARASQNSGFHLLRNLFPGDTVTDALDNQLNPTLKHIGPVIQQYFEASSRLCDGNLCAMKDGRWHFDSVSKISWQPCGCIYQMYSHLFVWGEMKHAAGDYLQTIGFYKVPCSIGPLKTCLWQNIYDPQKSRAVIWGVLTMTWLIVLRLQLAKCCFHRERGHTALETADWPA